MLTFFSTKNLLRAAIVGALALVAGPVLAQGEACVAIDSDVARLECFDAAFSNNGSPTSITPEQAVKDLAELVRFSSFDHDFTFMYSSSNPCSIKSIYRRTNSPQLFHEQHLVVSVADLSTVERIGGWTSGVFQSDKALNLVHSRGAEGYFSWKWGSVRGPVIDARLISDNGLTSSGKEFRGREVKFLLLVKEHLPDADKVRDAVQTAIDACQK